MRFTKRNKSIVDMLFLLALFGVFLISALFIVLFGARIYKKTANDMDTNFTARTSVAYITEKIHRNDIATGISVENDDAGSMLALHQFTDYGSYITYLYYDNGYLREITLSEDMPLDKAAGTEVLELNAFSVEAVYPGLYKFHVTDTENNETTFYVSSGRTH